MYAGHPLHFRRFGATPITWTDRGKYWDNYWGAVTCTFTAHIRATSGTVYARLYDVTSDGPVNGSQVSTSSSTADLIESSSFAVVANRRYKAQTGKPGGGAGEWLGCAIKEVQ